MDVIVDRNSLPYHDHTYNVHICIDAFMHVCMYICMYVYMNVRM